MKLKLSKFEAQELADYLSGTDAHMSVGDRMLLANRIYHKLGVVNVNDTPHERQNSRP